MGNWCHEVCEGKSNICLVWRFWDSQRFNSNIMLSKSTDSQFISLSFGFIGCQDGKTHFSQLYDGSHSFKENMPVIITFQ